MQYIIILQDSDLDMEMAAIAYAHFITKVGYKGYVYNSLKKDSKYYIESLFDDSKYIVMCKENIDIKHDKTKVMEVITNHNINTSEFKEANLTYVDNMCICTYMAKMYLKEKVSINKDILDILISGIEKVNKKTDEDVYILNYLKGVKI